MEKRALFRTGILNRVLIFHHALVVGITAALFSFSAQGQTTSLLSLVNPLAVEGIVLAPNFRMGDFRLETLPADSGAPDVRSDAPSGAEQEGVVKRSVKRIGADQRRLYLAPFKPHNFKWDALVLVGTGALLVTDRRIESHISKDHFRAYQNTSNAAIYGLAASLGGIYLYGINPEHRHARETGAIALETLVNTFLIYTPMQLIFGRQRPGEGNGNGDFFKHHAINTSFPGGHAMFTFAMASVLADEYPRPWARVLAYGAATTVAVTRFKARDHWASDMFIGAALGTAIAENTFHARCNPDLPSQCKHHQRWWKPMKMETQ